MAASTFTTFLIWVLRPLCHPPRKSRFFLASPHPMLLLLLLFHLLDASTAGACNQTDFDSLRRFVNGLYSGPIPGWQFDSNSSAGDCCKWVGVGCDVNGRIDELDLSSMDLQGSIANASLGSLDQLTSLRLENNSLSGVVPEDLFNLKYLKLLNLSRNGLNGSFPEKTHLPALEELDLSSSGLNGSLPAGLFHSTSLRRLLLQGNRFTGGLPDEFGKLTNLTDLDLSTNSFEGALPSSFSALRSIQNLNVNRNSFNGSIPIDFSGLPSLTTLDLGSNFLSDTIPERLPNCKRLRSINLARNKLHGEIPESFADFPSLEILSLSNNSLENIGSALRILQNCSNLTTLVVTINFKQEALPAEGITGFRRLQTLVVANCALSGSIPRWLSYCSELRLLDLSWNRLNGTIPRWLDGLSFLFYIDLSNNTLTGGFPVSFTGLHALVSPNSSREGTPANVPFFSKQGNRKSALQYNQLTSFPPTLDLSDNHLNGSIPPEIGQLWKLHVLDLSNNSFTGPIPSELSNVTALEVLDLSENHLTGMIPQSLANLTFLSTLNLSYNNLTGQIPVGGQLSTFKNSSFLGNPGLCGLQLVPCALPPPSSPSLPSLSTQGKSISRGAVVGIAVGAALGIILLLALLLCLFMSRTRSRRIEDTQRELSIGTRNRIEPQSGSSVVLLFQAKEPDSISLEDILKATGNFDQANIIGCGGFGLVYKATLPNGCKVAIKRLSGEYGQMEREFQAEVETLSRAQHKNLVPLQGYCKISNDRLLIYSYMENGSLDYWLHENDQTLLDWSTRLRIARGAARGLAYLHQSCDPHILHRDIKSSNILLNSNFEAHLADFGLARLMLPCDTHVTTDLVGTLGYIPPEYAQSPVATMKGDVYSFGVVLLELLTGRRPMDMCRPKECRDLISWVVRMRGEGKEIEVFDPNAYGKDCAVEMGRMLEVACRCLRGNPKERPLIQQIVVWLDDIDSAL